MALPSDDNQAVPVSEPGPPRASETADVTRAATRSRRLAWLIVAATIVVLLVFAQLTLAGMDGAALLAGATSESTPGGATSASRESTAAAPPPAPEELASEDPIPLTGATWRFFEDDTEANRYYDLVLEQDGSCAAMGTGSVYDGRYAVFGDDIEIELSARETVATVTAEATPGEVEYTIFFAVERDGNTMRGTGVVDPRWVLGAYGGPQNKGRHVFSETVYARPLPE